MVHYDIVQNYAMKCRLYPTETQKKAINDAITAVRVFHNCLVYDMWVNGINLKEKTKETTVHFPDLKRALSAAYKEELIREHPVIGKCPQGALTTNVGLKADLVKEFGKNPIEFQKPQYYNERHPRRSYTYQETLSKICAEKTEGGASPKAFRIHLALIGAVKVRGWNQKLRFGDEKTDFLQWCENNRRETVTVTVSCDAVGDYYIVFKIKECLKPFKEPENEAVGIDVGIKDIVICSDGTRFENKRFKAEAKKQQRMLNRRLSRRWGPSNEEYREAAAKRRRERKRFEKDPGLYGGQMPSPLTPSKRYLKTKKKHALLNRRVERKRSLYNHEISRGLVEKNRFIGMETLNIKGMVQNRHLSYALSDASMASILAYITYKAGWHGRTAKAIDRWDASSKRCSACGYIYEATEENRLPPWSLRIRSWTCPCCGAKHDRDINAAKNILFFALKEYGN